MSIYTKISEVMKEVEFLTNDVTVGSGTYAFKAISETKVTLAVRNSLIKNGLIIFPIEQTHHREDTMVPDKDGVVKLSRISTVDVKYRIVDIDSEECIEVVSSGTGCDANDKGIGKAITYAYKYMILKTFAIPTGDEHDQDKKAQATPGRKVIVTPPMIPGTKEIIPPKTDSVPQKTDPTPPKADPNPWVKTAMDTKDLNAVVKRIENGAVDILPKVLEMYFVTPLQEDSIIRTINRVKRQLAEKELVNA